MDMPEKKSIPGRYGTNCLNKRSYSCIKEFQRYDMNLRKFYFVTTIIVTAFLFVAGIAVMRYINDSIQDDALAANANNPINDILKPFIRAKVPLTSLSSAATR